MDRFDVVVVGGGSAGSALAGRLSEDRDRQVLVLEAGPHFSSVDSFPPEILDPQSMATAFPGHPNNWSFKGGLTQELAYSLPRGRIIGGCSSINGGYFVRGTRHDFDRWAELGNPSWSFDQVLPFFRRLENDHNYDGDWHGSDGPMPVNRFPKHRDHPIVEAFFDASMSLGFSEEDDQNAPEAAGVGLVPQNISQGVRFNAALAYLIPNLARPNLHIRGNHFVHRVIIEKNRVQGVIVEYNGRLKEIGADEVVLAAGGVKSPHILMLSGVGPASELKSHGISVVHDSPGVGSGFMDHPHLTITYRPVEHLPFPNGVSAIPASLNLTTDSEHRDDIEILLRMTGLGAMMLGASSRASQLRNVVKILKRPLRTLASFKGISVRRALSEARTKSDLSLGIGLQQPMSRGEILLASGDPHEQPRISYNYLKQAEDVHRMRQGVRLALELLNTSPMREAVATRSQPTDDDLGSDHALDSWMRRNLSTAIHLSRSCRMGPDSDPAAVVDQFCRVKGVEGLRVVDTSIMPFITSRGPNATAIMLGERASAFF